jgi:hypothetical protein
MKPEYSFPKESIYDPNKRDLTQAFEHFFDQPWEYKYNVRPEDSYSVYVGISGELRIDFIEGLGTTLRNPVFELTKANIEGRPIYGATIFSGSQKFTSCGLDLSGIKALFEVGYYPVKGDNRTLSGAIVLPAATWIIVINRLATAGTCLKQ